MVEVNNTTKSKISKKDIIKAADKFLEYHGSSDKDVSIAFVSENRIRQLNRTYRGKDKITDVLSFEGEGESLGEILICPRQIRRQAEKAKHSSGDELIFILIHGLLHLLGREDDTENKRREMIEEGRDFIKNME